MIATRIVMRRVTVAAIVWATWSSGSLADGGRLRIHRTFDDGSIAVFTSPEPPRAGWIDISVWVQDSSGRTVPVADVEIRLAPRGAPDSAIVQTATRAAATNKLFQAALVELPAAGEWDVAVTCASGTQTPHRLEFSMEVAPRLPGLRGVWPWLSWPLVAVALFAAHRGLVARAARATAGCKTARGRSG